MDWKGLHCPQVIKYIILLLCKGRAEIYTGIFCLSCVIINCFILSILERADSYLGNTLVCTEL